MNLYLCFYFSVTKFSVFSNKNQSAQNVSLPSNGGSKTTSELRLTSSVLLEIIFFVSELPWFVAHTKPRREKKLVAYCERQAIATTLPTYNSAHKYRAKTVVFRKPLFPGYVFLRLEPRQKDSVRQNDHIANLLEVFNQEMFSRQLHDILLALETDLEVRLAPAICEGTRVRIKSGPLQGVEGRVEQRYGQSISIVLLRLDFIGQAAAVKIDANLLEPT
jgi:transcription antitermination factor NusG